MTTFPLCLADMANLTEDQVFDHIAENYAGEDSGFSYGCPSDAEKAALRAKLNDYELLIAYESVGSWGCDSSSWFLLRGRADGGLFTVQGSHCSCYGFEGQGDIESVDIAYLRSPSFYFPYGGYDDEAEQHKAAVKAALLSLTA